MRQTEYYTKGVSSCTYAKSSRKRAFSLRKYASAGQRYKEWDFFGIVFFPFFRWKTAEEDMYKETCDSMPTSYDLYTASQVKDIWHYMPCGGQDTEGNQSIYVTVMPSVHIVFADGTSETRWFDTDEEAEQYKNWVVDRYGLHKWDDDENIEL